MHIIRPRFSLKNIRDASAAVIKRIHQCARTCTSDRQLGRSLLGCAGDDDSGAAQRARGMLVQPPVDAARVEQVPARREPTDHLPDKERRKANGPLLRRGGTLKLERRRELRRDRGRVNPVTRTTWQRADD